MSSRGKAHRKGITIIELMKLFPDEEASRKWFEAILWPNGPECPGTYIFDGHGGCHFAMCPRFLFSFRKPDNV